MYPQERPTGITIVAVLFIIGGALSVLGGLYVLAQPLPSWVPVLTSYQIATGVAGVVVGGLGIAVGWGLWTLQEWARIGAIVLLALGAIGNLFTGVGLLAGVNVGGLPLSLPGPGIASLFIAGLEAWMIWYLLKPETELDFMEDMEEGWAATVPATSPEPAPSPPPPPPTQEPSARPPRQPTARVDARPSPEGWLVLRSGGRSGKQFGLNRGRNTVGRDSSQADIVLDEDTVSGEHARVQFEHGQFYVYDLASTNGTYVNNRRVQKQMLMDGDTLRFGNAQMVFKRVD
jgi:hypothetical protein